MNIFIFHPVKMPPKDYGGVERVVGWLSKGLAEMGHQVTLGVLEGSQGYPWAKNIFFKKNACSEYELINQLPSNVDIVHFMAPPVQVFLDAFKLPFLVTIHGNGKPGEVFSKNAVFLSNNHAMRHGSNVFVYNGLDPKEYRFSKIKKDALLFLSKTSWSVKNLKGAMRICKKINNPLNIAGGERPAGLRAQAFFSGLFGSQMNWYGSVNGQIKSNLLSEARALLFPVIWEEPFGLVMIEAMASGTPVIATNRGSVPEVLSQETGLILDPNAELGTWVDCIQGFLKKSVDSEACLKRVTDHFHYLKMSENYLKLYNQVKEAGSLRV